VLLMTMVGMLGGHLCMYLLPRQLLLGVAIIACCFGGIFAILPVRGYAWPQLCACGRTVRGGRGCAPVAAAVRLWPQLCACGRSCAPVAAATSRRWCCGMDASSFLLRIYLLFFFLIIVFILFVVDGVCLCCCHCYC